MTYNIAVVGATGNVGQEVLNILAERHFPIAHIEAIASQQSNGRHVSWGDKGTLIVKSLAEFDFSNTHYAFFCAGSKVSKQYARKAVQQGATVIDKASHFRMDPDVALIVPEINIAKAVRNKPCLIASPNCVTIPLALVLKPLHDFAGLKRIVVSTYQSVSGAGRAGMDELYNQTRSIFVNEQAPAQVFPKPIAFNVIPHIDQFDSTGSTGEEIKIAQEIKKILGPKIEVVGTCVRVPVFIGHSMSVVCEFERAVTPAQARTVLGQMSGVQVKDRVQDHEYFTPVSIAGEDVVGVSRIRQDLTVAHGLCLWIVSDNLRKGAALNAVQIAEHLISSN